MDTTESTFTADTTSADANITISSVSPTTVASKSLSGGAIAGIVIGVLAGLCILAVLSFLLYKYRDRFLRKKSRKNDSSTTKSRSLQYQPEQEQPKLRMEEEGIYLAVNDDTMRRNPPTYPKKSSRFSDGTF